MSVPDEVPAAVRVTRSPRTARWGGIGFALAAVLQLLAVVRLLVPTAPLWVTPGWQLLGWLLGGLVLVTASVVLAVGIRGEAGVVGPSRWGRAALIVSGTGDVLLVAVSVLAFGIGPAVWGWTDAAVVVKDLLILVATATAAALLVRERVLTGVTRWALVPVAAVDLVAVVLAVIPAVSGAAFGGQLVARAVLVGLAGVAFVLEGRAARRG